MALSSFYYFLAILTLILTLSNSTSHHEPSTNLKSLHVTLYEHAIINKTNFLIVQGVPLPGVNSTMVLPIGSMFVLRELITLKPDSSSELVGFAEGLSITSSFDGLDNVSIKKININNLKGYKGSISILGSFNNIDPCDIHVIGGIGDFLFVQGFITSSLYDDNGVGFIYKLEFHLYWPPYATLSNQRLVGPKHLIPQIEDY